MPEILVKIDCDGEKCGKCIHQRYICPFPDFGTSALEIERTIKGYSVRTPQCLAAQRAASPLMEAYAAMKEGMQKIESYGKDGICPYGCDCPQIATDALARVEAEEKRR
jgi:hypothetical protein